MKVEAQYYENKDGVMYCKLCPHYCRIKPDNYGVCRGRMNQDGKLWAVNYGETTSIALDPIEKKPLYHFYPGNKILSIAPNNCNMHCPFCQNWEISQETVKTEFLAPETLIRIFKEHSPLGIAYTYTEPLMWYEYLLDAGALIHEQGGKNVLVSNGMINEAPLLKLLPLIDAVNIDLKTMDPEDYKKILGGNLDVVKNTIEIVQQSSCHLEITNLLVTGFNDKKRDIDKLVDYLASLDKNIPLHLSRYYPNYRYDKPPTPEPKLKYAFEQAKQKLNYVYLGNIPSQDGANTYCPNCNALLIERMYFESLIIGLKGNKCKKCGEEINIII